VSPKRNESAEGNVSPKYRQRNPFRQRETNQQRTRSSGQCEVARAVVNVVHSLHHRKHFGKIIKRNVVVAIGIPRRDSRGISTMNWPVRQCIDNASTESSSDQCHLRGEVRSCVGHRHWKEPPYPCRNEPIRRVTVMSHRGESP
jgi:hypothetical protein